MQSDLKFQDQLAQKELESDFTDRFLKNIEEDFSVFENDDQFDELKKSSNADSFILINKENLGEGSSRSEIYNVISNAFFKKHKNF